MLRRILKKNRLANNEYVCYDVVGSRVTKFKSVDEAVLKLLEKIQKLFKKFQLSYQKKKKNEIYTKIIHQLVPIFILTKVLFNNSNK